jgi:murein hydrolase activator
MVKYIYQLTVLVLMLGLVVGASPIAVHAENSESKLRENPGQADQSLKKLNRQIEQAEQQRKKTVRRERSILKQLDALDRQVQLKQRDLSTIEAKIEKKDDEINTLLDQMGPLQAVLLKRKAMVGDRLETIYKEGKIPYLKALMVSEDYGDFLKRTYYLQRVVQKEAELLTGYEQIVRVLEEKNTKLEGLKANLLQDRNALKATLNEIELQKSKKKTLLIRIRGERSTFEQAIEELEEASQRLHVLIQEMNRQKQRVRLPSGKLSEQPSPVGILEIRGHLNWPTDGVLISRFGLQRHPKFDTDVFRRGIEIGSYVGGTIRSIYDGKVVFADWFPGYGMVIILDHGENYFGLYAHLAKMMVSVGDFVKKDQAIGEVGSTGISEGDRLYFELRQGDQPVDPLVWLKAKP